MMFKKTTIYIVMAALWPIENKDKRTRIKDKGTKLKAYLLIILLYLLMGSLQAQENKAVDVTLKGIQIGQQVPDVLITGLHNYKDANGKTATTAKISDFKGKLLILDFWATWCSPCIAMIPKMDSLQKQFGDKIQFLSVTYQTEKEVLPFLEKFEKQKGKHYDLPVVTASKQLHQLFPHVSLPHYVWIDREGIVRAITGLNEINVKNINNLLGRQQMTLENKIEKQIAYDYKSPLFKATSIPNILKNQSILTNYIEGFGPVNSYNLDSDGKEGFKRITATNMSVGRLFQIAMGKGQLLFNWERTILDVKDTTKLNSSLVGKRYDQWLKEGNGFCYELLATDPSTDIFLLMQNDIRRYFNQYEVTIESRPMKVLVLRRTGEGVLFKTNGGLSAAELTAVSCKLKNASISVLNNHISYYITKVLDETGYTGKVDIEFDANMHNIEAINKALVVYQLEYVSTTKNQDYLVIRDKLKGSLKSNF